MKRKNRKYVEVQVNFPGQTIAEDELLAFCVDGASEHKAARYAKEVAREQREAMPYAGRATRKDKQRED